MQTGGALSINHLAVSTRNHSLRAELKHKGKKRRGKGKKGDKGKEKNAS
jgi:hypothetical protein